MSNSLQIRDTQTLSDLRSALARFAEDAQRALRDAEEEIRQTLEWLEERVRFWQRETERTAAQVRQASADLSRCESSGYRDRDGRYHQPDCSRQAAALRAAEARLRECQENLQNAQAWRSRVNQAADSYRREARRLQAVATNHTERARAELATLRDRYEAVREAETAMGGRVYSLGAKSPELGIGDVRPNSVYRIGSYEFHIGPQGETRSVSAKLELRPGRRSRLQAEVGKRGRITDEGGHLIGTRFNGPTDAFNLVPQNANLNRGAWKAMENGWAKALQQGHEVCLIIDPLFRGKSTRPWAFQVVSQIDVGDLEYRFFKNGPARATRGSG